jgi:hypothetical protein
MNGQCNHLESCGPYYGKLATYFDGGRVGFIYSSTAGLTLDTLKSFVLKTNGGCRRSQFIKEAAQHLREQVAYAKSHGQRHVVLAHSQGGIILYCAAALLTNEERMLIDVVTFGSAKLIPEGIFNSATNYVSKMDFVPLIADPKGYLTALFSKESNVKFLDARSWNPITEHMIEGPTYDAQVGRVAHHYVEMARKKSQ